MKRFLALVLCFAMTLSVCPTAAFATGEGDCGHNNHDGGVVTAPTCMAEGYTTYTCQEAGCGRIWQADSVAIDPEAHVWGVGEQTQAPTCSAVGKMLYTCTLCSATKTGDIDIAPNAHVWEVHKPVTPPTCTEKGYTTQTCSLCEYTQKFAYTDPVHTFVEDPAVDATESAPGLTAGKHCSVCGYVEIAQEVIPPIGATGGECGATSDDKVYWYVLNGELVVYGSGAMADYTSGSAPWYSIRESITKVTVQDGVTSVGNFAFESCAKATAIVLAESVEKIGDSAVTKCKELTDFVVPEGVKSIGAYAFRSCDNLISFEISSSVESIGAQVFNGCGKLTAITVDEDNENYCSKDGVLFSEDGKTLVCYPGNKTSELYEIPDGVTTIATYAFSRTNSIKAVVIPESVADIKSRAFFNSSIESVHFNGDAPVVADDAFEGVTADAQYYKFNDWSSFDFTATYGGTLTWEGLNVDSGMCGANLTWSFDVDSGLLTITGTTASGTSAMYNYTKEGAENESLPPWHKYKADIKSVKFENQATTVGTYAFEGCTNLENVLLANTVIAINEGAFQNTGIKSINIPYGVESISKDAFWGCSKLERFSVDSNNKVYHADDNGVLFSLDKKTLVNYPEGKTDEVYSEIPLTVTTIGEYAFHNVQFKKIDMAKSEVTTISGHAFDKCAALEEVILSEKLKTVKAEAFVDCDALTALALPEYVSAVTSPMFVGCDNLKTLTVDAENDYYTAVDNVLFSLAGEELNEVVFYPDSLDAESYRLPDGVTAIATDAFIGVTKVKKLLIPESVKTINDYAFRNSGIEEYCFLGDAPTLKAKAFDGINATAYYYKDIKNWKSFDFTKDYGGEDGYIDWQTYGGNSEGLFGENDGLKWVYYADAGILEISVNDAVEDSDRAMPDFASAAEQPWGAEATALITEVRIKDGVTAVGDYAFAGFASLKTVSFPKKPNNTATFSIGAHAFEGCSSLAAITLPTHLNEIGEAAFSGCSALTSIAIPAKVRAIADSTFAGCVKLTTVKLPAAPSDDSSAKFTIGAHAFDGCVELASVVQNVQAAELGVLPGHVSEIGAFAFNDCKKLTEITIGSKIELIGESAFAGCEALTTVNLPNSSSLLTAIAPNTFSGCKALTKVKLPSHKTVSGVKTGIVSIGSGAFKGCEALTYVYIPATVTTIADNAFEGCKGLETAGPSANIYNYAFGWTEEIPDNAFTVLSEYLTAVTLPGALKLGEVNDATFAGIDKLAAINCSNGANYSSSNGVLYSSEKKSDGKYEITLVKYPIAKEDKAFSVASNTTAIAANAFAGNTKLEEVRIDTAKVTSIGDNAFKGCTGIKTVVLSKELESIGASAFEGCALTEIVFYENVSSIGARAFANNKSLKQITFMGKVPNPFAADAFYGVGDPNPADAYHLSAEQYDGWDWWTAADEVGYGGNLIWHTVNSVIKLNEVKAEYVVSGNSITFTAKLNTNDATINTLYAKAEYFDEDLNEYRDADEYGYASIISSSFNNSTKVLTGTLKAGTVTENKTVVVTVYASNGMAVEDSFSVVIKPKISGFKLLKVELDEKYKVKLDEFGNEITELITETDKNLKTVPTDASDGKKIKFTTLPIPADAVNEVIWSIDKTDIATVDEEGFVTLKDIGEVTLTATAKENSNASVKVKLDVYYLDKAEELTAEVIYVGDVPQTGMQFNRMAIINIYGEDKENPLDPAKFTYTENSRLIEVYNVGDDDDDNLTVEDNHKQPGYVLSYETAGQATVNAVVTGDFLKREIPVGIKVLPMQVFNIKLKPEPAELADSYAIGYRDETGEPLEKEPAELDVASYVMSVDGSKIPKAGYKFSVKPILLGMTADKAETNKMEPTLKPKKIDLTRNSVEYVSSNAAIATVAKNTTTGEAVVTVKSGVTGACTIVATSTDSGQVEGYLALYVRDYAPRLGNNNFTLNRLNGDGVKTMLVESYENEIKDGAIEFFEYDSKTKKYSETTSDKFDFTYDGEQWLYVTAKDYATLENKTVKGKLVVTCEDNEEYEYDLTISVKSSWPTIAVKMLDSMKFDLFMRDGEGYIAVTPKDKNVITNVELDSANKTFVGEFNAADGIFTVRYKDSYLADYEKLDAKAKKPETKLKLYIEFDGYNEPMEKTFTLATTKTAVKLASTPVATTINTAMTANTKAVFGVVNVTDSKNKVPVNLEVCPDVKASSLTFAKHVPSADKQTITIDLNTGAAKMKGGTAKFAVRQSNWLEPVEVSHRVTVQTNLPTVKMDPTSLKINRNFKDQEAVTALILSQDNVKLGDVEIKSAATGKAADEAAKLEVTYADGKITARIKDEFKTAETLPAKGSYNFKVYPKLSDGTELKATSVKVTIDGTLPKVSLAKTSFKLNTTLAGIETATTNVKLNVKEGYRVIGFKEVGAQDSYEGRWYVDLEYNDETAILSAKLHEAKKYARSYPIQITPIVEDINNGNTAELPKLRLTVQPHTAPKITPNVTMKGTLDTTQRYSENSKMVFTINSISNIFGEVEAVELIGKDAKMFNLSELKVDAKGKQIVEMTLKSDAELAALAEAENDNSLRGYSTKKTYEVMLNLQMYGKGDGTYAFEVETQEFNVAVKQTPLKIKVTTVQLGAFQSQNNRVCAEYEITMTGPAEGRIESIQFNGALNIPPVGLSILRDENLQINIAPDGKSAVIKIMLQDTSKLTANSTYTISLDVIPEGNALDVKPVVAKLTMKVAK